MQNPTEFRQQLVEMAVKASQEVYDDSVAYACVRGINWLIRHNYDDRICVIAFEGTETFNDWVQNLKSVVPGNLSGHILAHRGFVQLASALLNNVSLCAEIRAAVRANKHIIFTGHSLGGALAQLIGEWTGILYSAAKIEAITFGAPPVFIRPYDPQIPIERHEIDTDPVPMVMAIVPVMRHYFRWLYKRKGKQVLYKSNDWRIAVRDHAVGLYVRLVCGISES